MFDRREDREFCVRGYLLSPKSIHTTEKAAYWGGNAKRIIADCKALIEQMEEYQKQLYDRVQEIETAPWHLELYLSRDKSWSTGRVQYTLAVRRVYDVPGIDPADVERRAYPGTERHIALADFELLKKKYPGIIAEKKIEKSKWER